MVNYVKLPFCDRCYKNVCANLILGKKDKASLRKCNNCCQWEFEGNARQFCHTPTPKDYPTTVVSDKDYKDYPECRGVPCNYVLGKKFDFGWLTAGVRAALHNIRSYGWGKGNCASYLEVLGIADSVIEKVKSQYRVSGDDDGTNNNSVWPKIWEMDYDISIFIEAPLHLIFHGVLATVVESIHIFMAEHRLLSTFENHVNKYLSEVIELRLEWCKAKTLPKKLWLGENELTYARILVYIYAPFFLDMKLPESNYTSDGTMNDLQRMINSLQVLICLLMTPRNTSGDDIDLYVKLFLSSCDRYSKGYYDSNNAPFWTGKGNFVSLLNLKDQINSFGSLRWYWEGTNKRFIQPVKVVLVSLRKSIGYLKKKMHLIRKLNVMTMLKEQVQQIEMKDSTVGKNIKKWHRYDSIQEVKERFNRGCIMSGVMVGMRLMVVVGKKRASKYTLVPVELKVGKGERVMGLYYHQCGLMSSGKEVDSDLLCEVEDKGIVAAHCLFLPLRRKDKAFSKRYGIIFDDWDVMEEMGSKVLSNICKKLFG